MVMRLIILLISCISVNTRYSLYQSEISQSNYPIFDCLYAYLIDGGREIGSRYVRNYHLIPYCRRPESNEQQVPHSVQIVQTITFAELRKKGVTSQQLLEWYAPIDVAERYEMNNDDDWEIFHMCESPWFGSTCQYRVGSNASTLFSEIVEATFDNHWDMIEDTIGGTCYPFLNGCNSTSWPLCLDWREICDGKIDCINEEDERWCDQLEMIKCADNEYRCHYGGQCIPLTFVKDSSLSIDCLDGSDEQDHFEVYNSLVNVHCANIQTFRCQERIGRYSRSFQCGDGQYLHNFILPIRASCCRNKRDIAYSRAILTSLEYISNSHCRQAFRCALYSNRTQETDQNPPPDRGPLEPVVDEIWDRECEPLSEHCVEEWLPLPEHPWLFGYFQLIYLTNRSVSDFEASAAPDFICFDEHKCPALLTNITTIELINSLICTKASNMIDGIECYDFDQLLSVFEGLSRKCWMMGIERSCTNASYFHCAQSLKCISFNRVRDGMNDCFYGEDENVDACQVNDSHRFVCESDSKICLQPVVIGDGLAQCPSAEDELYIYTRDLVKIVPFSLLCNRQENYLMTSPNTTENDETNCEWWPCNNPYTYCDKIWHCPNGADELNCPYTLCSTNEHQCLNEQFGLLFCLPVIHMFDRYFDDYGNSIPTRRLYFYNGTENIGKNFFSWNDSRCNTYYSDFKLISEKEICSFSPIPFIWVFMSDVQLPQNNETLCSFDFGNLILSENLDRFLSATRFGYFPPNNSLSMIPEPEQTKRNLPKIDLSLISYCHRGIAVFTDTNGTKACLCPPNYFGDRCQWQTQRVSLTLQFIWRSTASKMVTFQAIVMLIDEQGRIAPNSEQIIYIPSRDCDTKFNIYLLYPDRPKNSSNNYSIRINLFDKTNLLYWTSWLLAIPFPFLPVNRIVSQLLIPEIRETRSCSLPCDKHGQCMRYTNTNSSFFCHCQQGYTGVRCEIEHSCNCANDSLCLAPSICVCPLHKFGPHCYLQHSICHSSRNPCQHNGLCLPNDDRISSKNFTCFCTDDYSGDRCVNPNNRIEIQFDDIIAKETSLVLLHFITAFDNAEHQRTTLLKKIPFNQPILTLYISQPFHLVFVQIPNQYYYIAILREIHIPSESISTRVQSHQRCLSMDQLNKTLMNDNYLHRTKFYPLVCRQHIYLRCFYDHDLMCICDLDRFSNCFLFNHSSNHDCQGSNQCENGGQCFQNNQTCPTRSTCVCPDCYYGTKCQFSTKGFFFSLDPILGYHIKPHISLNQQPLIIKISIAINITMLVLGLISNILSIMTFCRKKSRQVGTGNYLLASSITSLCMIIILTLKFWNLVLSQMSVITNRFWLMISCKSIDYFLKVLLASSEWLNACVAIERLISVNKGANFNKIKSKKYSKWVIIIVFLLTTLTLIQDLISRQLIDDSDADEQRIWCFVHYSFSIQFYNTFITLFHFLVPFSIHLITALRIIKKMALRRAIIRPEHPYQAHLQQEIYRHQHLLFAPCMLIILSLPRLIISFMKGCMRSAREPWFYLIGYFVSFVPSMLTFVVFVSPSKHYRRELNEMYARTIRRFRPRT